MKKWCQVAVLATVMLVLAGLFALPRQAGFTAYPHMGEIDSGMFLSVYPDKAGTKLDNCNLCHSGGSYVDNKGNTVNLGSCQWCHHKYGYDASGNILETLNQYGKDYLNSGRNTDAVRNIDVRDSDTDGFTNKEEIAAIRYPGDPNDTPAKVPAPSRVFRRDELERMPQHTQFMLMNTHKSDDFYAEYTGVTMETLLKDLILKSATGVKVFAPDGFAQYHPLNPDPNPIFYHLFGAYPSANYYYTSQADVASIPKGWCDYSSPATAGRVNGSPISNPAGLKVLLAIKRSGVYLTQGVLNPSNKLDGEGPFRLVPPQKIPGPPDQKSNVSDPSNPSKWVWPFDPAADHNAGFSSRSVTIIKVEPLPPGTTDIDVLEAGWPYIDQNKIVVYGAIDPIPNVLEKIQSLKASIQSANSIAFKQPDAQKTLAQKLEVVEKDVSNKNYQGAMKKIQQDLMGKTDGCMAGVVPDGNDWVSDCALQKKFYWALNEIIVLIKIVA